MCYVQVHMWHLIDFAARLKTPQTTNYESAFKTIRVVYVCIFFHALLYWFPILCMVLVKHSDTAQCIIVIVIDVILIELFGVYISTGFTCTAVWYGTYWIYPHATDHTRVHTIFNMIHYFSSTHSIVQLKSNKNDKHSEKCSLYVHKWQITHIFNILLRSVWPGFCFCSSSLKKKRKKFHSVGCDKILRLQTVCSDSEADTLCKMHTYKTSDLWLNNKNWW